MATYENIAIDALITTDEERVVTVELQAYTKDKPEVFTSAHGSAICDPNDVFDFETGLSLAMGRALRDLSRGCMRVGNKRVHKADKARRTQQEANERRLARRKAAAAKAKRAYANAKTAAKKAAPAKAKKK